jgi:hypothetical protein
MRHERTKMRAIYIFIVLIFILAFGMWILEQPNANAKKVSKKEVICIANKSGGLVSGICADKPEYKPKPKDYKVRVKNNGKATIPKLLPKRVKRVIRAANKISHRPYVYGGGHGSFNSYGYDCSGSVSYALRAGGFVKSPMASGPFMSWGKPGKGKYITTYSHSGHMFMEVAGATFDTSDASPSRWQKTIKNKSGYEARYPAGF